MYVIETRIKTRSNKTIWMPYKQYRTTNGIENFQKRHQYLFDAGELRVTGNADDLNDAVSESEKFALYDSLNAVYQFAYRLSELTQRHLVLERSRTWKLAE